MEEEEEISEMVAAWIRNNEEERILLLSEEKEERSEERRLLRRFGKSEWDQTTQKLGLSTAEEFSYALGLSDVTNQWKGDVRAEKRAAMLVAGTCIKKGTTRGNWRKELKTYQPRPLRTRSTCRDELVVNRMRAVCQ